MASPFAFVARFLRRTAAGTSGVEILPPDRARAEPEWDLNASVEQRADAFVSLFLNNAPRDLRSPRMDRQQ